jgi:hypothetical protein
LNEKILSVGYAIRGQDTGVSKLVPVSQGNSQSKREEPLPEVLDERSVSNEGVKVVDVSSLVAMF